MKHTDNFQMNKPEPTDYYDIDHFNDNIDIIDKELQANKEHRENQENPHGVNKKQLGLDKVDNTSDADKPLSTLQRQAIDDCKITHTVTGTNPTASNSTDGKVIYLKNSGYTEQDGTPTHDAPIHIGGLADKGYFDGAWTQGYRGTSDGVYAWDNRHITNSNGIECKSGDIIKIKYEEIPERLNLVFYDKDNIHISGSYKDNVNEYEVTAPENAKYVYFTVKQGNITPSTAKHISVTINGQYAVRVKTGNRNLFAFGKTAIDKTSELRPLSNQRLILSEVDKTAVKCKYNGGAWSLGILVIDGIDGTKDYSFSYTISENTTRYKPVVKKDALSTETQLVIIVDGGNNENSVSSDNYFVISNLQVEYGTVATPYEPHQSSTALIPVSSPLYDGDYIEVFADGSGREYHKMNSVVYDGSDDENWSLVDASVCAYRVPIKDKAIRNSNQKCTHYIYKDAYVDNTFKVQEDAFFLRNLGIASLEDLKAELASNPMNVLYELATPTSTPLTQEQVSEFMKLQTFKGVTYVTADGEVSVRYYCNNDSGETVGMLQGMTETLIDSINTVNETLTEGLNALDTDITELQNNVYTKKDVTSKVSSDMAKYTGQVTVQANSRVTVDVPIVSTGFTKYKILGILMVLTYNIDVIGNVNYIGDDKLQVQLHNLTNSDITLTNGIIVNFTVWNLNSD